MWYRHVGLWKTSRLKLIYLEGILPDMITVKEYAPCTINLRIRPLKCYLKWLYDEGIHTSIILIK